MHIGTSEHLVDRQDTDALDQGDDLRFWTSDGYEAMVVRDFQGLEVHGKTLRKPGRIGRPDVATQVVHELVLDHELVHYLSRYVRPSDPPWLAAGLAMYFQT